jgi:SAM-dependent methyltransferase
MPSPEMIAQSATMARRLAPQLCRKGPVHGEDCSWYHGLWQDLRLLGLAATPEQQANFFRNAFARLPRTPLRVLISGSADYSILDHVLPACLENGLSARITVADLCETPLFFNRWYAEQVGAHIETVQADIFQHRFETPFNVICSHGFLSQFPPARRAELVRQWSRSVVPGGKVFLVNRVRPAPSGAETKFSEQQGREFCEALEKKLQATDSIPNSDWDGILARAGIYVRRLIGYALTEEELPGLFEQAGFEIDDCQVVATGTQDQTMIGPAIPTRAKHACVIASRR